MKYRIPAICLAAILLTGCSAAKPESSTEPDQTTAAAVTAGTESESESEPATAAETEAVTEPEPESGVTAAAYVPRAFTLPESGIEIPADTFIGVTDFSDRSEFYSAQFKAVYQDAEYMLPASELLLMPDDACIEACTDSELLDLASAMFRQYNSLYFRLRTSGGWRMESMTGDYMQTETGGYVRLEPAGLTLEQLESDADRYFAAQFDDSADPLSDYYIEQDGSLWVLTGYGDPMYHLTFEAERLVSRTEDTLVFDVRVIRTPFDEMQAEPDAELQQCSLIRENGVWKCGSLNPVWY